MNRFIAILILAFCGQAYGQNSLKNAVYAELGGNGYYYSINYERSFSEGILVRAGIGTANKILIVPILAGKYFGKGDHHLEVTGGITLISENISPQDPFEDDIRAQHLLATAFIGYRYQKPEKKFLFRVGYTPLFKIYSTYPPLNNLLFYQWGGLSFGYRF